MTTINRETSKGQVVPFTLVQDNLAASQTDVQLNVCEVAAGATLAVDGYKVPWGGEVIGLSWYTSAAATAGQMTIGATVNGTEDTDTTVTVTTATSGYTRVQRGKCTFVAGDILGAEITTNATWDGTTADLGVTIWALCYIEGI